MQMFKKIKSACLAFGKYNFQACKIAEFTDLHAPGIKSSFNRPATSIKLRPVVVNTAQNMHELPDFAEC